MPHINDSEREQDLLCRVAASADSGLPLPRLLMVFAHPDDEVLAVGGRLERMAASHLITVTDGTPQDGRDAEEHGFASLSRYTEARRKELATALAHAGLPESIVVPFEQVPDQTASLHLVQLARALALQIGILHPEAILTHPYEGGHPDHDACAFAVRAAVELVAGGTGTPRPVLLEAPFYHVGDHGSIRTGAFLHNPDHPVSSLTVALSPAEATAKRALLACFPTQVQTLQQFGLETESFRIAPQYDFTQQPHPGKLFYEQFPWGMTGERFRQKIVEALLQLGLTSEALDSAEPDRMVYP